MEHIIIHKEAILYTRAKQGVDGRTCIDNVYALTLSRNFFCTPQAHRHPRSWKHQDWLLHRLKFVHIEASLLWSAKDGLFGNHVVVIELEYFRTCSKRWNSAGGRGDILLSWAPMWSLARSSLSSWPGRVWCNRCSFLRMAHRKQ